MRRPLLRSLLLVAVLGAMAVGFVGFGVYIDRVERTNRIDDIDAELARAERNVPQTGAGDLPGPQQAPPAPDVSLDAVGPPVQLLVASDGTVVPTGGPRIPSTRARSTGSSPSPTALAPSTTRATASGRRPPSRAPRPSPPLRWTTSTPRAGGSAPPSPPGAA